ncbi:MAG: hypothetical protein KJ069_03430 [Anaerolineae bacterium]|nr:hypothetical protein [Anaerolineae bacterium]
MSVILILLAFVAIIVGFFSLSEATLGVGFIGIAGVLGILARIAQADKHHKLVMERLEKLAPAKNTVSKSATEIVE